MKQKKQLRPASVISLTFLAIIICGTLLFLLPFMTRDGKGLPFIKALFTATSSVCVTGLTLIDPAVELTRWGQILLLILIEVGGISLVTFATFFLFSFKKRSGFSSMRLAQDYTGLDTISQVKPLIRTIIATAVICQLFGSILLALRFVPLLGTKGIWISVFTACSAYCNAGFDIFGTPQTEFGSLVPYQTDAYIIIVVAMMILLGGLGFYVFYDLVHYRKTRKLTLHSKVAVLFSLILLAAGTIGILIYEYGNPATIGEMNFGNKLLSSFFQSVSARTAGFASVDIASFHTVTKVFMYGLMFIGAGSGSTGGGVKVTTFAVIAMTVISIIMGKDETIIFGKKIDKKLVSKSIAISILGIVIVFLTASMLFLDKPDANGIDVFFESISAFATVGISVGITGQLGLLGLSAVIVTMFIGRIGPICFLTSLTSREKKKETNRYEVFPEGKIMVG